MKKTFSFSFIDKIYIINIDLVKKIIPAMAIGIPNMVIYDKIFTIRNRFRKWAVSFSHGKGDFGTGTFKNWQSGFQPSFTSKINNFFSDSGTASLTLEIQSLKNFTEAFSPSAMASNIPEF